MCSSVGGSGNLPHWAPLPDLPVVAATSSGYLLQLLATEILLVGHVGLLSRAWEKKPKPLVSSGQFTPGQDPVGEEGGRCRRRLRPSSALRY